MKENSTTRMLHFDQAILNALKEDIPWEDVSANAVVPEGALGEAELIAKQGGVMAGVTVFRHATERLAAGANIVLFPQEGHYSRQAHKLDAVRGRRHAPL